MSLTIYRIEHKDSGLGPINNRGDYNPFSPSELNWGDNHDCWRTDFDYEVYKELDGAYVAGVTSKRALVFWFNRETRQKLTDSGYILKVYDSITDYHVSKSGKQVAFKRSKLTNQTLTLNEEEQTIRF